MPESDFGPNNETSERLFKVRSDLEALTRRYVDSLLSSANNAEEHAAALLSMLNAIADPVLVFDKDKKIILANRAAAEFARSDLQDLSRSELHNRFRLFEASSGNEVPEEGEPLVIAMREKRPAEIEARVSGEGLSPELWIRVHAAPILDSNGQIIGGVSVFQDITQRVLLQRQRDALSSLITHDITNHLIAESHLLELLIGGAFADFNNEDIALIAQLKVKVDMFLSLSTLLLEVQRTTLFTPASQAFDLLLVLKEVCEVNARAATLNDVTLKVEAKTDLPRGVGVQTAWWQVFHTLVQNAITSSPSGDRVEIAATTRDDHIIVDVVDSGPGIDSESLLKSTPKHFGSAASTGLGLYLCRTLVEAQGGKIAIQGRKGKGTVVSVQIQIAASP